MKRLILIALTALAIPASFAAASTPSDETIADRLATGKLTIASLENFISGSGLTVAEVQELTLLDAAVLVRQLTDEQRSSDK